MNASCVILWGLPSLSLAIYNEAGEREAIHYQVTPHELRDFAKDRTIIVVLMTPDVVFLRKLLPPLAARAFRKALPFAFEDQCIEAVENLHFSFDAIKVSEPQDVAVISKEVLQALLAECEALTLTPDYLVPGCLMLPCEERNWHVVANEILAFIRVNEAAGMACDLETLPLALKQARSVYGEPHQVIASSRHDISLEAKRLSEVDFVDAFLPTQLTLPGLNLLQGEFRVRKKKQVIENQWYQKCRLGLYSFFVLSVIFPMISWLMLSWHDHLLISEMKSIASHDAVQTSDLAAARMALEAKLQQVSHTKDDVLLRELAAFALVNQTINTVEVNSMVFESPNLQVEVSAPTPDDLSSWSQALMHSGLNVKQLSSDFTGGRVHATLMVY